MREAFQHRTRRALAATTPLHRGDQLGFHPLKMGELLANLGEVLSRQGVDLATGEIRTFREVQKAADLAEAEAQGPAAGDEADTSDIAGPISAVSGGGALWLGKQSDLFVVADRLEVAARGRRQFSDLHGLTL